MLGSIFKRKTKDERLVNISGLVTKNTDAVFSESIKAARTNLMYTLSDIEGGKCVLVTSSIPSEGKTSTTINLAVSLAQTESKVLLVDADLRRPKVHTYLEVSCNNGLANHLGGFCDMQSIIKHSETLGIDYVVAGDPPPNPSELLSSTKMKTFINEISNNYDYILIDTPPVNAVSDAQALTKLVSHSLVVVKCGTSVLAELKKAISSLEFSNSKILGFITISSDQKKRRNYSAYYHDDEE